MKMRQTDDPIPSSNESEYISESETTYNDIEDKEGNMSERDTTGSDTDNEHMSEQSQAIYQLTEVVIVRFGSVFIQVELDQNPLPHSFVCIT
jgi:hypothetical protein